jgi:type I restriction enzyme S subunit
MVTCIATPGLVSYASVPCQTNQQINSIIPKVHHPSIWLFWHMRSLIPQLIRSSGVGTVFANLNKTVFSNIKSIAPPESLRNAFAHTAAPLLEMMENLSLESKSLA